MGPAFTRSLLVCWMLALTASCGGGGGGGGGSDSPSAPGPVAVSSATGVGSAAADSEVLHSESYAAIAEKFNALSHESPESDADAMLPVIKSLPDVADAGISGPGFIWIAFRDGTAGAISTRLRADGLAHTLPLGVAPLDNAETKAVTNVPLGNKAFLHDSLIEEGRTPGSVLGPIGRWLADAGYRISSTVLSKPEDLARVKDAALFYMDDHGGIGQRTTARNSETFFMVATAVPCTAEVQRYYDAEIRAGEIGCIGVPVFDPLHPTTLQNVFAGYRMTRKVFITWRFVERHMTFAPGALVFINGCSSGSSSPEAKVLREAFIRRGAANVLGWDETVGWRYAQAAALYFFDRALGANNLTDFPVSPPNRPFDAGSVLKDMNRRNHTIAPLEAYRDKVLLSQSVFIGDRHPLPVTANLKLQIATGVSPNDPAALRPIISGLRLQNRTRTLTITGYFGTEGPGTVSIGGIDMSRNAFWTSKQITISNLPDLGPGSSGDVVVTSDGRKSNVAVINRWSNIVATIYSPVGTPVPRGPGDPAGARIVTTCTVSLRASANVFRALPGDEPSLPATVDDAVVQQGNCSYGASGRWDAGSFSYDFVGLAGESTLPWITEGQRATIAAGGQPPRYAFVDAQFNSGPGQTRTMYFRMQGYIPPWEAAGPLVRTTDKSTGTVVNWPATGLDQSAASGVTGAKIEINDALIAGATQETNGYFTTTGAPAEHAVDPDHPR